MKYLGKYIDRAAIGKIGGLSIDPKSLVEGTQAGAHKSPFHGFSVEFASHREYIPGDDTKHLDWVVYYKRDRYMIKQYEAETNLVCQLFLDASESMTYGSHGITKLDYASYLAVALSYCITRVRDSVGMGVFADKVIDYLPPTNTLAATYQLSHILEQVDSTRLTDLDLPMKDFAERIGRRQIVILISDFLTDLDTVSKALARLRYDKHEIVCFQVMDPLELSFEFEGRVKFIGLEQMPTLKLTPRSLRKAYLERVRAHNIRLREICERNNAECVLCDTSHSVQETLFGYLTSRLSHAVR